MWGYLSIVQSIVVEARFFSSSDERIWDNFLEGHQWTQNRQLGIHSPILIQIRLKCLWVVSNVGSLFYQH